MSKLRAATPVTKVAKETNDVSAPWSCHHKTEGSNIDAYIEKSGEWETIAQVPKTGQFDAQAVAEHIISAVNTFEMQHNLLDEMAEALKLCLACDGLTWEAEHDGEITMNRYNKLKKSV